VSCHLYQIIFVGMEENRGNKKESKRYYASKKQKLGATEI